MDTVFQFGKMKNISIILEINDGDGCETGGKRAEHNL